MRRCKRELAAARRFQLVINSFVSDFPRHFQTQVSFAEKWVKTKTKKPNRISLFTSAHNEPFSSLVVAMATKPLAAVVSHDQTVKRPPPPSSLMLPGADVRLLPLCPLCVPSEQTQCGREAFPSWELLTLPCRGVTPAFDLASRPSLLSRAAVVQSRSAVRNKADVFFFLFFYPGRTSVCAR